jgi:hypothetical protein
MWLISNYLPGGSGIISAKSYTHIFTSILPTAFEHLEKMGYKRDIHYVIGTKPPKEWGLPYNAPVREFENYITFFNPVRPVGFFIVSQEKSSGRGPNTDFLLTDETLLLNREKIDTQLKPTIRANKDRFKHISWHHGEFHCTSMPYTSESQWILDNGNYYLDDFGIDYFGLWRQVVKLQISLLDITEPKEFARHWNEIMRIRRLMKPRISKNGEVLFTLANSFDNIYNLGLSYILNQRKSLPEIIFLVEIMNMIMNFTDNAFYNLSEDRHVYYDSWNDDYSLNIAIESRFDFKKLKEKTSAFLKRRYYNPDKPLILLFDWGGSISFCLACQYDESSNTLFVIKEFFVLPGDEMPKRLLQDVCDFFEPHVKKEVVFVRDTYGDDKSNSIQSNKTINEDAISVLRKRSWKVIPRKHRHKEPPYHEKWVLMAKILKEGENLFKLRIDGNNCKYLVLAMKATKLKQDGDKLSKDKSLERDKKADQRTAPHSTDALDKGCYWLNSMKKDNIFIPSTLG